MFNKIKVKAPSSIYVRGGSLNADQFIDKEPRAMQENNLVGSAFSIGEYKEKPNQISYEMLKKISTEVAPISAIVGTRIDQIGKFTSQSRYKDNKTGFRIKIRGLEEEPTDEQLQEIEKIENFIINCGAEENKERDVFDTFLRKVMRDSLIYDQLTFEMIRDPEGNLVEYIAVDASTIRAATKDYVPDKESIDESEDTEDVSFVQVVNGAVVASFSSNEMAFSIRNPRTDINIQPYGLAEIETIIKQLSSYMQTEEYNMRFFQQGGMTKGILNIKEPNSGIASTQSLESFKRQWRTQVTGQNGAWRIPVFQLPGDLEFINISQSGGEMVFEQWINYLINICCAIYKIDPAEINFPNNGGVSGKSGGIFEGSNKEKYKNSKSKGLLPLLQFIENVMNKYIVSNFGKDYVFVFDGLDESSEEDKISYDKERVATYLTVNEIREERGLQPIDGGDIILNPYFLQSYQNSSGNDYGDMDIGNGESDSEYDYGKSMLKIETLEL